MFKAFNSNPTPVPAPEMYTALQQGVVAAMEGTHETAVRYGIMELAKYCLETHHVYNDLSVVVNKKVWADLPDDLKEIMLECGKELTRFGRGLVVDTRKEYRKTMEEKGVTFTPVDMKRAKELVADVYREFIGGDKDKQEIYDMLVELNGK